ncbi:MAG: gluconokinase [Rhodothermia bacterium]|nr:gluconokinase [Rhodothermia bacterium]
MGVAGCGKTTVGRRLATRTGGAFIDADDHHPPQNIDKMSSGTPLTDADRWPWLDAVRDAAADLRRQHRYVVVACSALKAAYRERLTAGDPTCRFVYLQIAPESVRSRLEGRPDHFMPTALVGSQFAALEEPDDAVVVNATKPVDEIVDEAVSALGDHLK